MPPTQLARVQLRRVPVEDRRKYRRAGPDVLTPIVKWAGGKSRLLDELLRRRPTTFRRYFEPFCGGAALYFRMAPGSAVLSDSNADLMNAYRCVAWNVEEVITRLRRHREQHCEDHYYATRERWNQRTGRQADVDRAAMFIYLNKTCYNGLWRVNRRGLFNVPMGRYTEPTIFDAGLLRATSRLLRKADLRTSNYEYVLDEAGRGDFVYFDPPYQPLTRTANFTSYTADCFDENAQRHLARVARALAGAGCAVMVSNSDTPLVRELYSDFTIDEVRCTRAINSKADSRGEVGEVIVTAG